MYMKIKKYMLSIAIMLSLGAVLVACKEDFLSLRPQGTLDENTLTNEKGIFSTLIGAYAVLDGWAGDWTHGDVWAASGTNWVWGSVVSDESHKGTDIGDQAIQNPIERYEALPTNPYFKSKWGNVYNGVARSNSVLNLIEQTKDLPEDKKALFTAEARFLRGHYHFEVKKIFNNVPYVDEKQAEIKFKVPNDKDIWPMIEEDLQFAADNLPETMEQVGRVNKWTAKAFLAKAYMYQSKYAEALPLLNDIIANGQTSDGKKYGLNDCYHDNFNAATKNSKEAVFSTQYSVNDGSSDGENGGFGDILNYPYQGGPGACCGFNQPSQNLVNSYKTDDNGLPLIYTFNTADVKNDMGIAPTAPFVPYTGNLDPRLDWTVGRRSIPYLDWGPHPGAAWIRDQSYGGPYSPKKNVYYKSQQGSLSTGSGWAQGANANNYTLIRFADVLLWAAECEVEVGSLEKARTYVNMIRSRAKNGCIVKNADGTPAANYVINTYDQPWADKTLARDAVRFERKLELAMEGHRFFDLVRWGIAAEVINEYLRVEQTKRQYLQGATFKKGKNEYQPIPYAEIINSSINGQPTLQQNPGY
jgi:starch-binding outer membrane protein, SusD/RagB family